jgi:hypothetical protein
LSALPLEDGDTDICSEIHLEDTITTRIGTTNSTGLVPTSVELDQITPDDGIIDARTEIDHSSVPTYWFRIENPNANMENFDLVDESQLTIICLAATHDETLVQDREFRSAQCHTYVTGE